MLLCLPAYLIACSIKGKKTAAMQAKFNHDDIGCKTRVRFVSSQWSVLIHLLLVKLRQPV